MIAERFLNNIKDKVPMINTVSGIKIKYDRDGGDDVYIQTHYVDLFIVANRFEKMTADSIRVYYDSMPLARLEPCMYVEYDPQQEGF